MKKETEFIYESKLHSFFNDTTTFLYLCFTTWFNENYCNGSGFLYSIILIVFITFIVAKSTTIQTRIYDKDLCDIIKNKKGLSDD